MAKVQDEKQQQSPQEQSIFRNTTNCNNFLFSVMYHIIQIQSTFLEFQVSFIFTFTEAT